MRDSRAFALALLVLLPTACTDKRVQQAAALPASGDTPVKAAASLAAPLPPPRVAKPAAVKALYLNAWAAGSQRKLARLIDMADKTEINSFVIDVKEGGEVSYQSKVKLAVQAGATREYIRNPRRLLDSGHAFRHTCLNEALATVL